MNNTATKIDPLPLDEDKGCADCADLRALLKQKHGECWPCAKTRHDRDWVRIQARKKEINA